MTVLDTFIVPAMQRLLILRQGQTPNDDESQTALGILQKLVDRWNADRLCSTGLDLITCALKPNKGVYTIGIAATGAAADFVYPRPVLIETAVISVSGLELPIRIATPQEWASIREKTSQAILPEVVYCDYAWPVANLYFHDIPQCLTPTSFIGQVWRPLPTFATLTQEINLPPAYVDAIDNNLSIRLAAAWGRKIAPEIIQIAADSKAAIRMNNARTAGLPPEAAPQQVQQQQ